MTAEKPRLKVRFTDFWTPMNQAEGNYFYSLLADRYELEISADPDILFYSNYGNEYLQYTCPRIFFSAENERPDFSACDYAISFDYRLHPRHLRFPLWALYYIAYMNNFRLAPLDSDATPETAWQDWAERKKFCCFIVSNPSGKKRNAFFEQLNAARPVDSAGRYKNNLGHLLEGGSVEKLAFIRQYRFVISFENSAHPGYVTEKLLEPLLGGCIPVYWGDPLVARDFNPGRFLDYRAFPSPQSVIGEMLRLDDDPILAKQYFGQPAFGKNNPPIGELDAALRGFIYKAVEDRHGLRAVGSRVWQRRLHRLKRVTGILSDKIKTRLKLQHR